MIRCIDAVNFFSSNLYSHEQKHCRSKIFEHLNFSRRFFSFQNSKTRRKSKIFENSTALIDSTSHHFFQLTKSARQSLKLKLVMKNCRFLNRKKKFV